MRSDGLVKYPRTIHLDGSRLQTGDSKDTLSYDSLKGRFLVLEEKMDGANCGVSFDKDGELLLQSRGHYLTGGGNERHFNLLKEWAQCHRDSLFDALGYDCVMFGEWMYAKHSVFYDTLPHYFLEFDIYNKKTEKFYSTKKRKSILQYTPVVSVPVLWEGVAPSLRKGQEQKFFKDFIMPSLAKSDSWQDSLSQSIAERGLRHDMTISQTDSRTDAEGLYGKIEEGDYCVGRFKYIRPSFTQAILEGGTHWKKRPIVPNQLKLGQNIYAPSIDKSWPNVVLSPKQKPKC